jgi:radical SAM-linked protein
MSAQLRRAAVPLAWSGGYSPKPRLVLAPALPVGVAGEAEYGDVFLRESMTAESFVAAAGREGPFALAAGREIPVAAPALETAILRARYRVEFAPMARALDRPIETVVAEVGRVLATGDFEVGTRRGTRDIASEVKVTSWDEEEAALEFELAAAATGALFDLVAHLTAADRPEARTAFVTRTEVYVGDGGSD